MNNPFTTGRVYCGSIREEDIGKRVTVCGWVARARDLGGLIFVDMRDREGIAQCVFDQTINPELFDKAQSLRSEYTASITGTVRMRARLGAEGDVEIEIVDNGCGIADIAQARKPFFSGDGGERAGMGFLVMESFMDSVEVESAPGEGTMVRMRKRLGAAQTAAARA